jgi:hypothetical protein
MCDDNHETRLDAVWQKRFDSLDSQITELIELIGANPSLYRQPTLYKLAQCLQEFAGAQFNYFFDGFNRADNPLSISYEFPPKHVITVTLQQISYDLEAIKWAVEQRLHGGNNVLEALQIGDKLAWEAMQPALNSFDLGENVSVVTYFQKFAEIRMIPYASVALIGLPITCIRPEGGEMVTRDYLATPHEIGHYVYWHAKMRATGKLLYQHLAEQVEGISFATEWLEEVFADVYGCLVAGPVIAQSFQDLQLRIRQEKFFTDDGEHPTPYIRPDIYTKVLQKRFGPGWANRLEQRWEDKRQERLEKDNSGEPVVPPIRYKRPKQSKVEDSTRYKVGDTTQHLVEYKTPADFISLNPGSDDKPVDVMINVALETISAAASPNWWWQYANLTKAPPAEFDLYQQFKELVLSKGADMVVQKTAEELHGQWLPEPVEDGDPNWVNVFRAGGWATKGPQTNPVSG